MYYYGGVHCTVVYTQAERAFESATGWFTFVKYTANVYRQMTDKLMFKSDISTLR